MATVGIEKRKSGDKSPQSKKVAAWAATLER